MSWRDRTNQNRHVDHFLNLLGTVPNCSFVDILSSLLHEVSLVSHIIMIDEHRHLHLHVFVLFPKQKLINVVVCCGVWSVTFHFYQKSDYDVTA